MTTKVTKEHIHERLKTLGYTVTYAAKLLGMTRQNFNKHLTVEPISPHFIRQFKEIIGLETKDVTLGEIKSTKIDKSNNLKPLSFDDMQVMQVPFVNQQARAGYLTGYKEYDYIETLPHRPWIVDREYKGTYMCFEVVGDSMNDGSINSYVEGDILLCREVRKDLWQKSKLHIRNWDFVIAHKDDGIVVKKIIEHQVENGIITVHSLNELYADYTINLKDVIKIFNVVRVERKR